MGEKKFFFRLNAEHAALMVAIIEIVSFVQLSINEGLISTETSQCVENVKVEDEDEQTSDMPELIITLLIVMIFDVILLIGVLWGKRNLIMSWIVFGFVRIIFDIYNTLHISWNMDVSNSYLFFWICYDINNFIWTSYSIYVLISSYWPRSSACPSYQIAMNIAS